jgi:Ser-tRNA(Ala) deacylase AlaX
VQNNADQQIEHYGHNISAAEAVDNHLSFTDYMLQHNMEKTPLKLQIDEKNRVRNTHLHSLGHMLDAAMKNIGYDDSKLKPAKGHHFNDGPYVEYEIADSKTLAEFSSPEGEKVLERMREQLYATMLELITQRIPTVISYQPPKECPKEEEEEKLVRIVTVAGCDCPCGGTHIQSTEDIHGEDLTISKIKRKKNILKISYSLK